MPKPQCPGTGYRPYVVQDYPDKVTRGLCPSCEKMVKIMKCGKLRWHSPEKRKGWPGGTETPKAVDLLRQRATAQKDLRDTIESILAEHSLGTVLRALAAYAHKTADAEDAGGEGSDRSVVWEMNRAGNLITAVAESILE